jgi:hypothetical protein
MTRLARGATCAGSTVRTSRFTACACPRIDDCRLSIYPTLTRQLKGRLKIRDGSQTVIAIENRQSTIDNSK